MMLGSPSPAGESHLARRLFPVARLNYYLGATGAAALAACLRLLTPSLARIAAT